MPRGSISSLALLAAATPWLMKSAVADFDAIAGYTPVSDVTNHAALDLDMEELEEGTDLETEAGFLAAWDAYANGGNSEKTDSIRTIRGFSTSAQEKLTGETWFDVYEDYWGEPDYADIFTSSACNGTEDFAGAETITRAECCLKGAQYQNVWMYVIHELEDAIGDCKNGDLNANDGGPHAWDEGWAFYAGSSEGTDGDGDGFMIYALADKRCENFATCTGDDDGSEISGTSAVNAEVLDLFHEGQTYLLSGDCNDADDVKDKIIDLISIPLMQGLLRYLYKADPRGGNGGDKEEAELWAFAASILPRIHECDADVASTIRANTELGETDAPVADGYVALKEQLESVYSCMGISCSQVGGLVIEGSTEYYEGFSPCGDGDDGNAEAWGIGIGVVAAVAVAGIVLFVVLRRRRNRKKTSQAMESDLGGFGGKNTGTL